jgi:hypothetical protein
MSTGHWLTLNGDKTLSFPIQVTSIIVVCMVTLPIMIAVGVTATASQLITKVKEAIYP